MISKFYFYRFYVYTIFLYRANAASKLSDFTYNVLSFLSTFRSLLTTMDSILTDSWH